MVCLAAGACCPGRTVCLVGQIPSQSTEGTSLRLAASLLVPSRRSEARNWHVAVSKATVRVLRRFVIPRGSCVLGLVLVTVTSFLLTFVAVSAGIFLQEGGLLAPWKELMSEPRLVASIFLLNLVFDGLTVAVAVLLLRRVSKSGSMKAVALLVLNVFLAMILASFCLDLVVGLEDLLEGEGFVAGQILSVFDHGGPLAYAYALTTLLPVGM